MSVSDNSISSVATVVPLPHRQGTSPSSRVPVWPIDCAESGVVTPLLAKCSRHSRADGICCKELRKEERTLIDPDVVRDV